MSFSYHGLSRFQPGSTLGPLYPPWMLGMLACETTLLTSTLAKSMEGCGFNFLSSDGLKLRRPWEVRKGLWLRLASVSAQN